ncbi:MAG: hypothetical protein HY512_01030 [Candidatus Aenigmarchaeota archaeon]|nr:hypothetical protein [Candidatus Aenigmarchaeota archaeon]
MKKKKVDIKKKPKSRNRLKAAALSIPLLIGGYWANSRGYLDNLPVIGYTETETDRAVDNFPENLPGASRVRKHKYAGSRNLMVHIQITHSLTERQLKQVEELRKLSGRTYEPTSLETIDFEAARVFNDVYRIVTEIRDHYTLRAIYVEGLTVDNEVLINDLVDEVVRADPKITETPDMSKLHTAIVAALGRLYPGNDFTGFPRDTTSVIYQAAKATLHGKLWATATEDERIFTRARRAHDELIEVLKGKVYTQQEIDRISRLIDDDREDGLLSLLSDGSYRVAVVVYGKGHDWKNNIQKWNRKHKTDRFSLVEIYPHGL